MTKRFRVMFAGVLALMLALPAAAQWKWKDARGQTQYSDLPPPPGTPDAAILARPSTTQRVSAPPLAAASAASAAASANALTPKAVDSELEAKKKKTEQDAKDKAKAEDAKVAAAKADNCERAKSAMRAINVGQRLSRTNAAGEREYLDDAARAAEVKHTQSVIAADCK